MPYAYGGGSDFAKDGGQSLFHTLALIDDAKGTLMSIEINQTRP